MWPSYFAKTVGKSSWININGTQAIKAKPIIGFKNLLSKIKRGLRL